MKRGCGGRSACSSRPGSTPCWCSDRWGRCRCSPTIPAARPCGSRSTKRPAGCLSSPAAATRAPSAPARASAGRRKRPPTAWRSFPPTSSASRRPSCAFTQHDLGFDLIVQLARVRNIVGLKASGDFDTLRRAAEHFAGTDFSVLSGHSTLFDVALGLGARGIVDGLFAAAPEIGVEIWRAMQAGDGRGAARAQQRLQRFEPPGCARQLRAPALHADYAAGPPQGKKDSQRPEFPPLTRSSSEQS
ncbi:MAG: hypothetical protein DMG07_25160 [Acidobacteria bacterium]|nr:MAG: hypothetical protein DMG07_25160 [Acidobacteriota bacterium]